VRISDTAATREYNAFTGSNRVHTSITAAAKESIACTSAIRVHISVTDLFQLQMSLAALCL